MMIYFGQELGERGMDAEGFSGKDGRTTIFDYWHVDTIRRWRNKGKFDTDKLTAQELALQAFYTQVLRLCNKERALREGDFYDLMYANNGSDLFNADKCYAFVRRKDKDLLIVLANFEDSENIQQSIFPTIYSNFSKSKRKENHSNRAFKWR
mgnify:CR=1 FL=1